MLAVKLIGAPRRRSFTTCFFTTCFEQPRWWCTRSVVENCPKSQRSVDNAKNGPQESPQRYYAVVRLDTALERFPLKTLRPLGKNRSSWVDTQRRDSASERLEQNHNPSKCATPFPSCTLRESGHL